MHAPLATPDIIRHLEAEAAAFAELVAGLDPATEVPTCPGWSVSKLASHLGTVHRWAAAIVEQRTNVDPRSLDLGRPGRDAGSDDWSAWLLRGAADLVAVLGAADPAAGTWTWAHGDDGTVGWWIRRQLHETAVHRIDAELAAGNGDWTIDPLVAVDGIDEHLGNVKASAAFSPGVANLRGTGEREGASLHLHATDVDGEWMIRLTPDGFEVTRDHAKGTVAVRGTARDLLAAITNRSNGSDGLELFGDADLFSWWRANSALS